MVVGHSQGNDRLVREGHAAARRPGLQPIVAKPLTFEVEDAKGNKVFKKEITTSKFGIAAAEFVLGNEINLGRYTIRAEFPGFQPAERIHMRA